MFFDKPPDLPTLRIEEGEYCTRLTKKFQAREKWEPPDPRKVQSFIPGMVVRIAAHPGQRLAAGTPLLTFEAMKMENTLTMPCEGIVKHIHVKVGEVFAKDIVLVSIEPV
jgi:biotin carboxyl carrier protein